MLALTDLQIQEFKALLDKHGFKLSAIGSPIGKIRIDDPFEPHLEKFKRAIDLCGVFGTTNIRIFSYYPPDNFDGDWTKWRDEVMSRMTQKCELAEKAGVRLVHENEHRIYGDSPERVTDLMSTLRRSFGADVIGAVYDPANYVFCGYDPWRAGWRRSRDTVHFHIKDWKTGEQHGCARRRGRGPHPRSDRRRGEDGLRRLRDDGAAPARRRPDRRRHGAGAVPQGGRGVQDNSGSGRRGL